MIDKPGLNESQSFAELKNASQRTTMYAIGKLAASRLSTVLLAGPPLGHGLLPVAAVAFRSWSNVTRNAEKLLEVLAHSPAMQQVMLANLPPALRGDPAMVKAILSDPGVKQKLVEMISKQVLPQHLAPHFNTSAFLDHHPPSSSFLLHGVCKTWRCSA
ncbi:uncharacterized protein HaLaN_24343 [Haematococcus lacustris]|uniref:Uncharacterized protein n=1 Tax=Haematococcus lacustris TaxID=44745 RepID=A0A699ZUX2_HAELA|nr:uncharacterized protein HaLaN_24343 [Haematococcus lacustris]